MSDPQQVINFSLSDKDGNIITLNDFKGKNIVIYFYPKDDTPGCTVEAQDFSTLQKEFAKNDTTIIGISKDTPICHQKFSSKYNLTVLLLSDIETTVCQQYGVWKEKTIMGKKYMGIERTTFLINKNFEIEKIWHKVKAEGHALEVLSYIQNIK